MANINKNQIGYEEVLTAGTANALMVQYKRANAAPLDISEVFTSISAATEYAKSGPISYAGQVIAVAGEGIKTEVFTITSASTIVRLVDENDLLSVEQSAGKIDEIKVNGTALTIDGKSVNIDLSEYVKSTELDSIISGDTGKTIREIANEEIASKLISEGAQESLDTLEEIAAWIQSHPEDAASMNEAIVNLEKSAHTHGNKEVLDGVTADKVTAWDNAEKNAKDYADGLAKNYDVAGAAASALTDAKAYVDGKVDGKFDEAGAAASAETAAKKYADDKADSTLSSAKSYSDGLAKNYEVAGAAAQALADAKADAEAKYQVKGDYEAAGAAATVKSWVEEQKYLTEHQDISNLATKDEVAEAVSGMATEAWVEEQNYLTEHQDISNLATKDEVASAKTYAKEYADGLASNYDSVGAADAALSSAKAYVDGKVDGKFDTSGAAATAEKNAKDYADGLAKNYDVAGAAASALTDAKAYVDGKVDGKFDEAGAAASAETAAKKYADGLASNYDVAGAAASALTDAKKYADGLASNYDVAGAAASALTDAKTYAFNLGSNYDSAGAADAALSSAKAHAEGLGKNYDKAGSAASALTDAKAYVDGKLVDYATQSYVTEQIVSAMTGGEIELTGYAKVEEAKSWDASTLESAKTYTDAEITKVQDELMWLPAEEGEEKHVVRHWRGTRANYEFLKRNGALSNWTKYVVIDTIANKDVIVEYYGENQISNFTGQLLPVNSIVETIAEVTPAPYDRYLVGTDGIGYNIYECVLDDEGTIKWYVKPFDYRYGVRVRSKGLKNYVLVDGILTTYDDIDCGTF